MLSSHVFVATQLRRSPNSVRRLTPISHPPTPGRLEISIHPLYFLQIMHSLQQRVTRNSFRIKLFGTLFISMGGYVSPPHPIRRRVPGYLLMSSLASRRFSSG